MVTHMLTDAFFVLRIRTLTLVVTLTVHAVNLCCCSVQNSGLQQQQRAASKQQLSTVFNAMTQQGNALHKM